jgi:hypothetical protein
VLFLLTQSSWRLRQKAKSLLCRGGEQAFVETSKRLCLGALNARTRQPADARDRQQDFLEIRTIWVKVSPASPAVKRKPPLLPTSCSAKFPPLSIPLIDGVTIP